MKKVKVVLLSLILLVFALLYLATSVPDRCLEDCQKVNDFAVELMQNRKYIYGVFRCSRNANADTLCVFANDSVNINWNLLADTACAIATQKGLIRQTIFFIDNRALPLDTMAIKVCP